MMQDIGKKTESENKLKQEKLALAEKTTKSHNLLGTAKAKLQSQKAEIETLTASNNKLQQTTSRCTFFIINTLVHCAIQNSTCLLYLIFCLQMKPQQGSTASSPSMRVA